MSKPFILVLNDAMQRAALDSVAEKGLPPDDNYRYRSVVYDTDEKIIISAWKFDEKYMSKRNFIFEGTVFYEDTRIYVYRQEGEPKVVLGSNRSNR